MKQTILLVLLLAAITCNANIRLPRIFSSHMVLQRGTVNQIWGWADNPHTINLYNKEGLPAHPFRTDEWPGITVGKK